MNVISYQDEEIADNNANYFLVEMKEPLKELVWKNWKEISIKKEGETFFEFTKENNMPHDSIFYCFEKSDVSSSEELNFNNLKKCQDEPLKNKFLVISTSNELKSNGSGTMFNKKFNEWNTNKPDIFIEVMINGSSTVHKHDAKVLKIFHKEYKPATNSNS